MKIGAAKLSNGGGSVGVNADGSIAATPAAGKGLTVGGLPVRSPSWADPRDFGAKWDGVTNDTTALQNAGNSLAATGGLVMLPAGTGKISTQISLPIGVGMLGQGSHATTIDATAIPDGNVCAIKGADNNVFPTFSGFAIKLNTPTAYALSQTGLGFVALDPGNYCEGGYIHDILCNLGGNVGVRLYNAQQVTMTRNYFTGQHAAALWVHGGFSHTSLGCVWTNSYGLPGVPTTISGNIVVDLGDGATVPTGLLFADAMTDEGGNNTIYVRAGSDIQFLTPLVYLSKNGYGVQIGNGTTTPNRITLRGMAILPYAGDRVPLQTLYIQAGATNVTLDGVTTVPNGGGDILDNGTGTVWRNVNGITRSPTYTTATKPAAAAANAGMVIYVSDGGAGNVMQASNGSAWVSLG